MVTAYQFLSQSAQKVDTQTDTHTDRHSIALRDRMYHQYSVVSSSFLLLITHGMDFDIILKSSLTILTFIFYYISMVCFQNQEKPYLTLKKKNYTKMYLKHTYQPMSMVSAKKV